MHNLNLNWSKNVTKTTVLSFGANEARTITTNRDNPAIALLGITDNRRFGVTGSVSQIIKKLTVTVSGSRNWFRDRVNDKASNIVSSLAVNSTWNVNEWFQMNSNFSLNWTAGDSMSVGNSHAMSLYLQPNFLWRSKGLTITPLVTINEMMNFLGSGVVTADSFSTQYGGRVAWQMPGRFRFSTFSIEGSAVRVRNGIDGTTILTPRLMFLWTIVPGGNKAE